MLKIKVKRISGNPDLSKAHNSKDFNSKKKKMREKIEFFFIISHVRKAHAIPAQN